MNFSTLGSWWPIQCVQDFIQCILEYDKGRLFLIFFNTPVNCSKTSLSPSSRDTFTHPTAALPLIL